MLRDHEVAYINVPEWQSKTEAADVVFIPYVNYLKRLSEQQKNAMLQRRFEIVMQAGKVRSLRLYENLLLK